MPDQGGAGCADYILFERVALLREAQGDGDAAVACFNVLHHPELNYVPVFPGGVVHFAQELSDLFYTHFANSSSLMILWASPHFSTIQST